MKFLNIFVLLSFVTVSNSVFAEFKYFTNANALDLVTVDLRCDYRVKTSLGSGVYTYAKVTNIKTVYGKLDYLKVRLDSNDVTEYLLATNNTFLSNPYKELIRDIVTTSGNFENNYEFSLTFSPKSNNKTFLFYKSGAVPMRDNFFIIEKDCGTTVIK